VAVKSNFIEPTGVKDLWVINPIVYGDERGYFYEVYNEAVFKKYDLLYHFVQDNESYSSYGVLRGLHFQVNPYSQSKLVRVAQGKVLDVAVDLRSDSPTKGKWFSTILSAENRKQMLIPQGFAHGFVVLSKTAKFIYKCDNPYSKAHDSGIAYNDPALNIDWMIPPEDMIVSEKDKNQPLMKDAIHNF